MSLASSELLRWFSLDAVTLSCTVPLPLHQIRPKRTREIVMEPRSRRCIRSAALPSVGLRKYVQIYAKRSRKMLPSSPSPRARKGDYRSRSGTPSNANTPPSNELPELSDVQCYTCRRRHVRCDRILPHWLVCIPIHNSSPLTCSGSAKCRKRGIQCLGYTKPLR